jgi:HSP20 family protein
MATLIRWEPVRELSTMQSEMNRLFNTFFDSATPGNGRRARVRSWIPAMDVTEHDNEYVLKADLPGLSEDDVNVELDDNVLRISGERKSEHEQRTEGYYRVERASGRFSRALTLPEGVSADGIQATFDNGVLEVHVQKPEQRKPHKVAISVGQEPKAIEGA